MSPRTVIACSVAVLLTLGAHRDVCSQETAKKIAPSAPATDIEKDAAAAPNAFFQRAWHLETAEGKVEEALAMYRGLAAIEELPQSLRAKSLYRAALCLRKLRRTDEAKDTFLRIKAEFPDAVEVVQAAEQEIGEASLAEAIVARKAREILLELWTANRRATGDGRISPFDQLLADLDAVGPGATPYIVETVTAAEPHPASDHLAATLTHFAAEDTTTAAVVRRLLRDGRTELRVQLLDVIGNVSGEDWRDLLIELTGDDEAAVRAEAAEALYRYRYPEARAALKLLLADAEASVRVAALEALAASAVEGDLAAMREAYADTDADVRAVAVNAVRQTLFGEEVKGPDLTAEAGLLDSAEGDVLAELVILLNDYPQELSESGVTTLVRRMDAIREIEEPRRFAIRRGSQRGPTPASVPRNLQAEDSPYELAVRTLVANGDPQALPVFLDVMERGELALLDSVLERVGALGDTRAVPALIGLLAETSFEPVRSAPRGPRRAVPGSSVSDVLRKAWELLTGTFWSEETLGLFAGRLAEIAPGFQLEALGKVLDSGRTALAEEVFAQFAKLERQTRYMILEHRAFERADRASVVAVLEAALLDEENAIREKATERAQQLRFEELVPALIACWRDSFQRDWRNPCERVIYALGSMADPRGRAVFFEALAGKDEGLADQATNRFPESWAGPETTEQLLELITSPTTFYPKLPAKTLEKLAAPSDAARIAEALAGLPDEVRPLLAKRLGELGEAVAIPPVRAQLGSEHLETIEASIAALADIATPDAVDAILAALTDARVEVREWAVTALRRDPASRLAPRENAVELLAPAINDEDPGVRGHAARILGDLGTEAAARELARMLADPSGHVRKEASYSLAESPHRVAVPEMSAALAEEGDMDIAGSLVTALCAQDASIAVPALIGRLRTTHGGNNDENIKGNILLHLRRLPARTVADAVIPLLDEPLEDELAADLLSLVVSLDDPRAADVLIAHLDDENTALRRTAVAAAGSVLDRRALPALIERLRDRDSEVRTFARRSIESIRFYEEQRQLAGQPSAEARALAELVGLLESEEPAVRRAAVDALARTGTTDALPAIVRLRNDTDPGVRAAVERALDALTE